jgi:uncharacterized protein (TIGR03083 family)
MTSLADRTIVALGDHHDALAEVVPNLTDAQLTGPSGASEWTVAQVLSHLGSGSEIALASFQSNVNGGPAPEPDFNQSVWDRWNAMSPQDQASGFLEHDERLVEALDALTPEQRESLQVKLPFLPEPVPVSTVVGMRLNEVALHSWDVRVALDPTATLDEEAAAIMAEQLSGGMSFMLGFIGKADQLAEPTIVDALGYGLSISDTVSLTTSADDATATFAGPIESLVRLIGGRLTPAHTPDTVRVLGDVDLDDLRRVFPGY